MMNTYKILTIVTLMFCCGLNAIAADYLSPTDVCVSADGKTLYVAEQTAGQVAVYDITAETVTGTIPLPASPQVSGVALSPEGQFLYVTAFEPAGQVYVVNTASNTVIDTISFGHCPSAPVVSHDGSTLYVCNRFANKVSAVNLTTKAVTSIPVTREPVAAALTPDGSRLVVANLLPADATTDPVISSMISMIDTSTNTVTASVRLLNGSIAVRGLCISPDGQYAYAVHLLAKYHVAPNQIERGWTSTNAMSILDLNTNQLVSTVLLDDLDKGAANPWDVACSDDGTTLVVTHAGTHEISIIDRDAMHEAIAGRDIKDVAKDFSTLVLCRRRVNLKGKGPQGLVIVNNTAYAAEYFSGSLGVMSLSAAGHPKPKTVSLGTEPAMSDVRKGELIYKDATLSFQNWVSCSSCHPGARADALNWDELNDGFGNAKQTKSHLYSHFTPPTTITGCRPNAETSVRAGLKYAYFNTIPEVDAQAVDAYLSSLTPVPSPYLVNGQLSVAAARGKLLFEGSANCAGCHDGTYYTNMQKYDVGTGFGRHAGTEFDTPTLSEVWRTAPYLYRGQAKTIHELLTTFNPNDKHGKTQNLSVQEINDLAEYVLSLGEN